ncbi:MAG: DUF1800 family protein [Janthinobacterium lividum]
MRFLAVLCCLLLSVGGLAHAQPLVPIEAALAQHLLNRLGYGPAPGEVARVRALGAQAWVDSQLALPPIPPHLQARLRTLSGPEAALLRAIASPRQLEQVLVRFWLDYFRKEEAAEALVRPHVLGRYADLRAELDQHAHGRHGERSAMGALVRHFVSAPSAGLQASVWRVWEATGGDQRAVLRQLLTSPEFLAPAQWNSKEKDGFRFVASAVRASGLAVDRLAPLVTFAYGPLPDAQRAEFVERLAAGRLALTTAPVQPHEYASSAPPLRAGTAGEAPLGTLAQPGPVLMAAPTPSAAAMAAARSRPAYAERLREQLQSRDFLRY